MNIEVIHSYKELTVWQKSVDLVTAIYELTANFPKEEIFGLTSQMRRAAISIPSNIAEGRSRGSKKDYVQFLRTAFSSGAELETQVIIARRLPIMRDLPYEKVGGLLEEVMKMLNVMIRKMNPSFVKS